MIHFLLDPTFHGLVLLAGWTFSKYYAYINWAKRFKIFFIIWLSVIFLTPVPKILIFYKERLYPPINVNSLNSLTERTNVLILGAGKTSDPALSYLSQLSETELSRLTEGIRVYKILKSATIITSGDIGRYSRTTQALVAASAAVELGVSPSDTAQLGSTKNTEDEAAAYVERFGDTAPLVLVTSAIHMPRAMYLFRKLGINPIPSPTNYLIKIEPEAPKNWWLPSVAKLSLMKVVIHEYVGLWWAQAKS